MDQNLNNSPNDFLWSLLENPANDANSHVYNLHRLVNDFPQSGILQALLAHASEEKNLKRASAYFSPRALFKLINAPSTFTGVPDDRIVIQPGISVMGSYRQSEPQVYQENADAYTVEDLVVDKSAPPVFADEEHISHHTTDELVVDHNAETYLGHTISQDQHEHEALAGDASIHEAEQPIESESDAVPQTGQDVLETPIAEHVIGELSGETEVHAPSAYVEPETTDHLMEHETVAPEREESHYIEEVSQKPEEAPGVAESLSEIPGGHSHQEDAAEHVGHEPVQEVYEEKAEHAVEEFAEAPQQTIELDTEKDGPEPVIELPEEQHEALLAEIPVQEESTPEPEIATDEISAHRPGGPVSEQEDEIYDEIVSIEDINLERQRSPQFISFDQEFGAHENGEERQNAAGIAEAPASTEAEQHDVSKYHDEKMPYTFMWWLDKTRKEHAQAYQPYIKPPGAPSKKEKKITDELQQQYFENIFHITSVEELDKATPPPAAPDFKRKEQVIIERFIKEEPQIKPQSSDKLDNENKAKKSSEDRDELVSETLAGIYSDQMLYHKAIASYKKLILKFPEKSRYFAEKIEQLEKKTN